ncbi:MAG: hypothetical protein WC047_05060 [Kiritimatiellales bacterium]
MNLSPQIESYLLERGEWVKSRELCERFGVTERQLRAIDDRPGLCTMIAIGGNKGFKHISLATPAEWEDHYARERKHNIMALVNLRAKRRLRMTLTRQVRRPELVFERDSGQILMEGIK